MKILLISANTALTPYPVYPLGMSMVARALEKAGHETAQYDYMQHGLSIEKLKRAVVETDPGVIGISIRNIDNTNLMNERRYVDVVGDVVAAVRNVSSVPIVLGGSGFSLLPESILETTGADYGVVGEGETAMVQFVDQVARHERPESNIITPAAPLRGADIPAAVYDPRIMKYYQGSGNTASVQTKRGCTHRCAYCTYPALEGHEIRCREPGEVVDELERLIEEFDIQMVFFTDSVFNDDEGRYLELLHVMKEREMRIRWTAFMKPELFEHETLALMKATGLQAVELGADAASDTALQGLNKSFRFADVVDCNNRLHEHGLAVAHYYMFGGPGETRETVEEGIRNIADLENAVSFIFMGIRILPGAPLEDMAVRDGIIRPGQDLLEPVYYIAPGIGLDWLQARLTAAFEGVRHCVFPPESFEEQVRLLHQLGHVGVLWDYLRPGLEKAGRRRGAGA